MDGLASPISGIAAPAITLQVAIVEDEGPVSNQLYNLRLQTAYGAKGGSCPQRERHVVNITYIIRSYGVAVFHYTRLDSGTS